MNFSISQNKEVQVLLVNDLLNEFENKKILNAAQTRIEGGFPNFVVDLGGMDFMNSVGLNFLIALRSYSLKSGGRITLANVSRRIRGLLHMTKLDTIFSTAHTVEDAVDSLSLST